MATLKPTTPLLTPNKGLLKPASPLHPKNAPKTPISRPQRRWRFQSRLGQHPQRRRRFQSRLGQHPQRRWRFHSRLGQHPQRRWWFQTGPPGRQGQTAAPMGGGGAWPGFNPTRRAKGSQRGRLAGGQAPRRPEICRGNKQKQESSRPAAHTASTRDARNTRGTTYNKTARPHRGQAAQPVSVTHRRITTMSGSPRPLSWRTSEIPSLAATSFAVPSMRGSS